MVGKTVATKSADKLNSKVSVTYSSSITFETVNTSPDLQYEYGQGYGAGDGEDNSSKYFYYLRSADPSNVPNYNRLAGRNRPVR